MSFFMIVFWCIVGFIIGSLLWADLIAKYIYKVNLREYGSGNLGGTNAGRVLGKKAGVSVIILDALKAFITMTICYFFCKEAIPFAGACACLGHCFSVFNDFKGGKGVATAYGYFFGLAVYGFAPVIFVFVYPVLIFFLVLGLSRYVSLSSMIGVASAAIIGFIFLSEKYLAILLTLVALLVILRHYTNIIKLINHKESKIKWLG